MYQERDTLRTHEEAIHASSDMLVRQLEDVFNISSPVAAEVLSRCIADLQSLYSLIRYRALAQIDEVTCLNEVTGLPISVEVGKVRQDALTSKTKMLELTAAKSSIIEHLLARQVIPEAYINKAVKTAYRAHASRVNFGESVFFPAGFAPGSCQKTELWCAWFTHVTDGRFGVYLMRFALDHEAEDLDTVVDVIKEEATRTSLTAPGVIGAKIDEESRALQPKEVHAWFFNSLVIGGDLADSPKSQWQLGEYLVSITYERAVSIREETVSLGFFLGDAIRQVWETGGEQELIQRLCREQRKIVCAPHVVLQRMHSEIQNHSLLALVDS